MVKVISQETFDAVVKENIEEFGLDPEEATKEAVCQFESQGVNLVNIVTDVKKPEEEHATVAALAKLSDRATSEQELVANCKILQDECSKGLAEKVMATKHNGYPLLLEVALRFDELPVAYIAAVEALSALLAANPDPFDEKGFGLILHCLEQESEPAAVSAGLSLTHAVCVRHEINRQNLVKNGLLDRLDKVFDSHTAQVSGIWFSLVQDDDVRVPFGKAHDTARDIVENHGALEKLAAALKDGEADKLALMTSLRSLTVRNEYCQKLADVGMLDLVFDLLSEEPRLGAHLIKEALLLLKTMAGNDNIKNDIRQSQRIGVIVPLLSAHIDHKGICHAGCSLVAAICLRMPENGQQVAEANGVEVLTHILQRHMKTAKVVVAAVNAMRNVVSRNKALTATFVEKGVEDLFQQAMSSHSNETSVSDAVKAALRDMDLKVHLKCEWNGTGVQMQA